MKHFILSVFVLLLILSSCEEIIYRERVVLDTLYIQSSFRGFSLDSVKTISSKIDTVYESEIVYEYDTVLTYLIDTVEIVNEVPVIDTVEVVRIDSVEIIKEVVKIDTVFVEVVIVDTVERVATITYLPMFEPHVIKFFELIDNGFGRYHMLNIDVHIDTIEFSNATNSYSLIENGVWNIGIRNIPNCIEARVYREMFHCLFGRSYQGSWHYPDTPEMDHIMTQNWPKCLEDMSEEERNKYIGELFGN